MRESYLDFASGLMHEDEGLHLRRALYAGVLSSLGATLGWFLWIATYAFRRRPSEILVSALIGGALGLLVEGFRRYRSTALLPKRKAVARNVAVWMGAASLSFIGIVSQDIFIDVIGQIARPFAASLITLFPIGAIFSLVFQAEAYKATFIFPLPLILGALIGWATAFLVSGIYLLMGEPVSGALSGWWIIIALGYAAAFTASQSHPLAPFSGALVGLFIMWFAASVPLETSERYATGTVKAFFIVAPKLANTALTAPDLPAAFWNQAEAEMQPGAVKASGATPPRSDFGRLLPRWAKCNQLPSTPTKDASAAYIDRKTRLCRDLAAGLGSGLSRSWLVILCFSLGLGLTMRVEKQLRPRDYFSSKMQVYDRVLLLSTSVLIVTAALVLRLT
jgi:hypothetical protein